LKKVNDNNSLKLFNNFIAKFAFTKNAKDKEISYFDNVKTKHIDNFVKKNNNGKETYYNV